MKTKWLLCGLWVFAVLFVAVQSAMCEEIKGIKSLNYYGSGGMTVNSGVIYELTCGDEYTVKIKQNGQPYEEAKTYPISDEQVEAVIDLLNKYEVWKWDGFDEHDPDVMDGRSFSFSLTLQDGKEINARGYMMYPENFGEVIQELSSILEEAGENNSVLEEGKEDNANNKESKEEGDGGVLVPVIIGAGALVIVLVVLGIVRRTKKASPNP